MDHPVFVGLDLSLTGTGLARIDMTQLEWCISARVSSTGSRSDTLQVRRDRLSKLTEKILEFVHTGDAPPIVLIEAPAFAQSNAGTWDRAGLWWGVVGLLLDVGVELEDTTPTQLKRFATGRGTATKPDMRMALFQRTGVDLRDDNEVDARWLALAAAARHGSNPAKLPKSMLAAAQKL